MVGVWTFDPVKLQSWKPWSSATAPRIPRPRSPSAEAAAPQSKRGWGVQGSAPMKRMCGLSAAAPAAAAQRPGRRSIAAEARISGSCSSPQSPAGACFFAGCARALELANKTFFKQNIRHEVQYNRARMASDGGVVARPRRAQDEGGRADLC